MERQRTLPVRKAWYAGSWYSADNDLLRTQIEQSVGQVSSQEPDDPIRGPARFALLPHAGLAYSSRGLAHLIVNAPSRIDRVVILAPSHNAVVPDDTLSFGLFSGFETPLGVLESWVTSLEGQGPDASVPIQREHAVEMVLPFLAYLQDTQRSPIRVAMALINQVTDLSSASRLAESLLGALEEKELESGQVMIIASSDFSHYGQRFGYAPFGTQVDEKVVQKVRDEDLQVANLLGRCELGPLFLSQRMRRRTICGIAGASVVSALARLLDTNGWVADYYTSLDVLGDRATDFVAYGTVLWR